MDTRRNFFGKLIAAFISPKASKADNGHRNECTSGSYNLGVHSWINDPLDGPGKDPRDRDIFSNIETGECILCLGVDGEHARFMRGFMGTPATSTDSIVDLNNGDWFYVGSAK